MQYLPEVAIIISLTSLFFTLRNSRFNNRVKIIEAKNSMLIVLSDLALSHTRNIAFHSEIHRKASRMHHPEILRFSEDVGEKLDFLKGNIDRMYELTKNLKDKDVITGYEIVYPEIKRLRDDSTQVFELLSVASAKYAQVLAKA